MEYGLGWGSVSTKRKVGCLAPRLGLEVAFGNSNHCSTGLIPTLHSIKIHPIILYFCVLCGTMARTRLLGSEQWQTLSKQRVSSGLSTIRLSSPMPLLILSHHGAPHKRSSNSMVLTWIFNALSPELHDSVAYVETARDMWLDLKERQSNATRIQELKHALANLQQRDLSVAAPSSRVYGMRSSYIHRCRVALVVQARNTSS